MAPLEANAVDTAPAGANAAADRTPLPGVRSAPVARLQRTVSPPAGTARRSASRPLKKASCAADCRTLEQLPNIGPAIAADLRSIGIAEPGDLVACDAMALYRALCARSGRRQDPCVLDTFMAAVDFMQGAAAAPWWRYTAQRKARFGAV